MTKLNAVQVYLPYFTSTHASENNDIKGLVYDQFMNILQICFVHHQNKQNWHVANKYANCFGFLLQQVFIIVCKPQTAPVFAIFTDQ